MRSSVMTAGHHPRIIFELNCDEELLTQLVRDGEFDIAEITACITRGMKKVNDAIIKGQQKLKADKEAT